MKMKLAWSNASVAAKWHGVGSKKEYFKESLKLAHAGIDLKKRLIKMVIISCVSALFIGFSLGLIIASFI